VGGYAEWPPKPGFTSSGEPLRRSSYERSSTDYRELGLGSLGRGADDGRLQLQLDRARAELAAVRAVRNRLEVDLDHLRLHGRSAMSLREHWSAAEAVCRGVDALARWAANAGAELSIAELRFQNLDLY
jgi:hypothetical protein